MRQQVFETMSRQRTGEINAGPHNKKAPNSVLLNATVAFKLSASEKGVDFEAERSQTIRTFRWSQFAHLAWEHEPSTVAEQQCTKNQLMGKAWPKLEATIVERAVKIHTSYHN